MTMRDIGVDVRPPEGDWDGDENCPFYGTLRLRGQVLEGTVSRFRNAKNGSYRKKQCSIHEEV